MLFICVYNVNDDNMTYEMCSYFYIYFIIIIILLLLFYFIIIIYIIIYIIFITLYHWNTYIIKNKHQNGIFTKHQNILHTLSIKFCTSEWQGLTGASTSRTVPPITKISLRGPPLRKKNKQNKTMITSRRVIVYGAKKLMDSDIFHVMVKDTVLLWLLQ